MTIMNAKVAVTGAGGYIGSVMVGELLRNGYKVRAIDAFYFGDLALSKYDGHPKLEIVKQDIRLIDHHAYDDCDYAIDLAALSNDPSGDLDPELTRSINEKGRIRAAMAAKRAGVRRYLFASSCAVYGAGQDMFLTEDAVLRPLTIYAQTCARAEEAVLALNTGHFAATALRNATVFGLSPRMRFDLVVNQMTFDALDRGRITVGGDGSQWRPVVHVRDVAAAFLSALRAPSGVVAGAAFNIGWDNRQIVDIALAVKNTVTKASEIEFMPCGLDRRDYHVSFARGAGKFRLRGETPDRGCRHRDPERHRRQDPAKHRRLQHGQVVQDAARRPAPAAEPADPGRRGHRRDPGRVSPPGLRGRRRGGARLRRNGSASARTRISDRPAREDIHASL